ncbi:hypothetical protein [Cylindrospermopsis raciborskii]|uniref:Molecular chaperone GrpE n=1 Tax=Cylindrospermopsis raciborskii CENA302 TaxID=1170768 RepID=A0A9Q5WAI2_9CYAN|nr:hypothetical protein [Cylindrospermopsis raciborskii]MCZ2203124.1 molecular chaperone GrpE [Cylindrospermopsis raciborskii PAMP2012]MCZ2207749.1 molecular chaperone GrpE [Cylindrospermopsis raciborskii PAMP2011]NLQ04734.1 molecular chaperone GrpE [Cylindrospermopsis raciborskii MVCC19]OHY32643.1 hypothetical protein BCV64_02650 [Cylindrospermopsis raciborskii MVCC14]OPH10632.1 hypothetical protein CENA302_02980 [Cylindrospermopsis raciborskii CENA302]
MNFSAQEVGSNGFNILLFIIVFALLTVIFKKRPEVKTTKTTSPTTLPFDLLDLEKELNEKKTENEELKNQCHRLTEEIKQQKEELGENFKRETFYTLQPLFSTYPTIKKVTDTQELPAKNFVPMLIYLDNLINNWGYTTIGTVWEQVAYNPQYHEADSDDIQETELVYIRFVGYRQGETIIYPAKVSRTLPDLL